jgi:hypothetical protein
MKKWLLISGGIALLFVVCLFLLSRRTVVIKLYSSCTLAAADRCFPDTAQWAARWPKDDGCTYTITGVFINDLRLAIRCGDGATVNGDIRLAPLKMDSILISWDCRVPVLFTHREGIRHSMEAVLQSFKAFIDDDKNIYGGVHFYRTMSRDSTLVTITSFLTTYPTTDEVYRKIDSLRQYMISYGAAAIDSPWLNVTKVPDGLFRVMVAIPGNKGLPGNGRIVHQDFVPWKMVQGDVHGGVYTVEKAFDLMQKFKIDHPMSIMALPFQVLITDRRREQDTTKWVTIVAAPIS